jgi:photosystem II stability/assembly factor-like uncharacterized protein
MNTVIKFLPVPVVLLLGFWFLHSVPLHPNDRESLEEHRARERWMHDMLADPATGQIPPGIRSRELQFLHQMNQPSEDVFRYRSVWNFRGPQNVGGRTRGVCIDCKDDNHILAGSVSGGIWQTFNGGDTWTKVTAPNDHPGVVSICQDTREGYTHIWYALSGEITGTSASGGGAFYFGDGAFISTDNGSTWKTLASTAAAVPSSFTNVFQTGWRIVSSPKVDTLRTCIYMATYGSIYRSTDTGNTWQVVLGLNNNDSYYTDVAVSKSGVVYASMSHDGSNTKGFFRSADGINFTNITPSFLTNTNRTVLEINPNNENEVLFLSHLEKDSSGGVVTYNYEKTPEYVSLVKYKYLSGDGTGSGGQWTNLSKNLPVDDPDQFDKFNCQGGYDLMVRIQPLTNFVIIGGTNLYLSKDGFASNTKTTQIGGYAVGTQLDGFGVYDNHHPDQHDVIFFKNSPNKMLSASDGGVKICPDITLNKVYWYEKSIGYNTSQFYTVTIDEKTPFDQWMLGGLQDNGNYLTRTNSVSQPWNMTINGDGAFNYIAPDKSFCIISTQLGNTRKVELDANGNVLKRRRIDPEGYDKNLYGFINCIAVDPNNDNILYMPIGKRIGIFKSARSLPVIHDNNKLTFGWTITDSIKTPNLSPTSLSEITTIAVSKSPANVVYFGTNNREVYRLDNPLDAVPVLTRLTLTRLPGSGYISDICIDPDDANKLFVIISNYNVNSVFYSYDGGQIWKYAGGNLESNVNPTGAAPSIRCAAILKKPNGEKTYFLGTSIGLFSTDSLRIDSVGVSNLTVWKQESPDLIGANVITDIKTRDVDGYVAVATHGNGAFDSYYTGLTPGTPYTYALSTEVYPNPATSFVNFTFSSIRNDIATAFIVDMMGRRVRTLFSEKFNSGTLTYRADVNGLAPGHYNLVFYTSSIDKPFVHRFIKL